MPDPKRHSDYLEIHTENIARIIAGIYSRPNYPSSISMTNAIKEALDHYWEEYNKIRNS